ncbi:plasmid transfer protein TraA [Streptomyces sp. KL116D]|uniref:plasmid transfer protein TraA n=1 Tax=Streptomyces sp. KL116D TaxID=3045152 RepID=UPI0035579D89
MAQRTTSNPSSKGNKFVNVGAAAGGFAGGIAGGLASTFTPPINININRGGGGGRSGHGARSLLPAPEFYTPAQMRNYCNSLRALAVMISFEASMGAEILQGVLCLRTRPRGPPLGSRIRAAKVSRKLKKSANA